VGTRLWLRWPDVTTVALDDPASAAVVSRALVEGAGVSQVWTPMDQISPQLALAVLVAEDIEFFQHRGFSVAEMRIAMEQAREGGRMRGASTITQQLAKNLWLSGDRTLARKAREAVLAVDLERFLTKRRILELYLNVVPFGPAVVGAEAAARRYFDKPALFLTEMESAQLAAALTRPSRWYPGVTAPEYAERVDLIRRRMTNAEFLWRHLLRI
jgi:monofunctional biosynthetic peptidoglycan transglycosylase